MHKFTSINFRWWLVCYLSLLWTGLAGAAAPAGRDLEREAQVEQEVAAVNPSLVEPFRAARVAMDAENYPEAERLLLQVCAQAPNLDPALRRLGSTQQHLGKPAEALKHCEKAVALRRSYENLFSLAYVLISSDRTGSATKEELQRAQSLLQECRAMPRGTEEDVLVLSAQVALSLQRMVEFQAVRKQLGALHPQSPMNHYFSAIDAALANDWVRAEDEIRQAVALGFPQAAADRFLASGVHAQASKWRLIHGAAYTLGCWIVGLVALYLVGMLLSRVTLRQAEAADVQVAVSSGERRLRSFYRALLNAAGVYYYISLPVVILLVIGIFAAIFYTFLLVGHIPIKLILFLALGALFTIYAMVRSLFIKVQSEDPGRALQLAEAPALWDLTGEVAQTLGTRPIDEIRLTPGTEVAVYERGSWSEKLRNQARRVLILGTGVLNGFQIDHFRCVLAHEYGHFSNRDTAGGDIGLRVRQDMMKFYLGMCEAGQATAWNIAFHFLRLYNFLFRRISHGATRLQEILADRVAAQNYGAAALEGGLSHVIRRSLEFDAIANREIKSVVEDGHALQNLYEITSGSVADLETQVQEVMNRKTTDDDTHPSPVDRFRLVSQLNHPVCSPHPGEVWDLFLDRPGITREMMAGLEQQINEYRQAQGTDEVNNTTA